MKFFFQLSLGEVINGLILLTTAVIIWLYTRAAQKSNEIQEKPILNLYLRDTEDKNAPMPKKILKLRNVGKGPAYNIQISGFQTEHVTYTLNFRQPNFILEAIKDERAISFDVEKKDGAYELSEQYAKDLELFIDRIFPRDIEPQQRNSLIRTAGMFLINYDGVNGKTYHSIFRIYPKTWPLLGVYDLVIEFVENDIGRCDESSARQICSEREVLLTG